MAEEDSAQRQLRNPRGLAEEDRAQRSARIAAALGVPATTPEGREVCRRYYVRHECGYGQTCRFAHVRRPEAEDPDQQPLIVLPPQAEQQGQQGPVQNQGAERDWQQEAEEALRAARQQAEQRQLDEERQAAENPVVHIVGQGRLEGDEAVDFLVQRLLGGALPSNDTQERH